MCLLTLHRIGLVIIVSSCTVAIRDFYEQGSFTVAVGTIRSDL